MAYSTGTAHLHTGINKHSGLSDICLNLFQHSNTHVMTLKMIQTVGSRWSGGVNIRHHNKKQYTLQLPLLIGAQLRWIVGGRCPYGYYGVYIYVYIYFLMAMIPKTSLSNLYDKKYVIEARYFTVKPLT